MYAVNQSHRIVPMRRYLIALMLIVGGSIACRDITEQRSDPDTESRVMNASSSLYLFGTAGSNIDELPAVIVRDAGNKLKPVAGVPVRFRLIGADSTRQVVIITTGYDGVARLPSWRLGTVPGRYQAIAEVDGLYSILFTAFMRGAIVAVYDIDSLASIRSSSPLNQDVHFVLYEDRSYYYIAGRPIEQSKPIEISGEYKQIDPQTIEFDAFVRTFSPVDFEHTVLFARATLEGREMRVLYLDEPYDVQERFVLRTQ